MQKRTAVGFLVIKIPAYKNTKTIERTQKKSEKKTYTERKQKKSKNLKARLL